MKRSLCCPREPSRVDEVDVTPGPTLRIGGGSDDEEATVPAPVPPADPDAWYAPDVRAQYESAPGVVATIRSLETGGFAYDVREPHLSPADERALDAVRAHFASTRGRRPLTRAGAIELAATGFEPKYARVLDRLLAVSDAARRRLDYHALRALRLFGDLTPIALDDRIAVADVGDDEELIVHTDAFAPLETGVGADAPFIERVAGERLARYTVAFAGFSVDVVVYRERLLGSDAFETKYAALEPDLLPGDESLIRECKRRIWETPVDHVIDDHGRFVADHARRYLSRRLTERHPRGLLDRAASRLRRLVPGRRPRPPTRGPPAPADRIDDLVYYVVRDFVGEGVLTVPIRDPHLEDIEANRVGERVKVVPRPALLDADEGQSPRATGVDPLGGAGRVPTNLRFDDEASFVNVVTRLAARDGVELTPAVPSAKVNLELDAVPETVRCAVALPAISADGPHVSIRKQAADPLTPVDLVRQNALSTSLVTLLWMLYEHHGVVLFAGPTGAGKTTLMNACMPFIPFDDRPISIDEGSREVRLPHETGVALTTRDHEHEYKSVHMAALMTEANYLNPDVEVIAEINTPASFETFAETVNAGHGVVGTTHATDVDTLVNRAIERGLPPYLFCEVDLVVFLRQVGSDRYVTQAVEPLAPAEYEALDPAARTSRTGNPKHGGAGVVERPSVTVHYNTVAWRDPDGAVQTTGLPTDESSGTDAGRGVRALARLADRTDRDVAAVETEFHTKHRYVRYLVRDGVDDFTELFEFLADLRADEAATVERVARSLRSDRAAAGEDPGAVTTARPETSPRPDAADRPTESGDDTPGGSP